MHSKSDQSIVPGKVRPYAGRIGKRADFLGPVLFVCHFYRKFRVFTFRQGQLFALYFANSRRSHDYNFIDSMARVRLIDNDINCQIIGTICQL